MNERRIRVLTLVSGLAIGEAGGGADKFGLEIARHLDRSRFEPAVCAFWRRGTPVEEHWRDLLEADGVRTFFAAERGAGFSPRRYLAGVRRIAREAQPGAAIIHTHFQLGSIAALLLRRTLDVSGLVRTAHGEVSHEWSNSVAGRLGRLAFTRTLFPLAFDQEVGVSRASADSLNARWLTRVSRRPAIMIPNAIPLSGATGVDRAAKRRELGLPPNALVIGSVGRLAPQKGHIYLLEAAPAILAQYPNARIILAGDGELRAQLEAEARRLGIEAAVAFLGMRSDVAEIYDIMDLFVLASLWEGLPTVVLEAMTHRVPVVATDIPGTSDLVTDGYNGWLARPADPDDLARAILAAIEQRADWPQVTARAAEETAPQYTIESVARQYETLFEALLHLKTQ